jgi:hypothetical protein
MHSNINSTGQGSSGSNGGLPSGGAGGQQYQKSQQYNNIFRCLDHGSEDVKGFCKDCSSGICFRCAIGKHRNHNIVNIDELEKSDLENQIGVFENKIEMLKEKAKALLDRAKNSETHIEQLPDITMRFAEIQERFRR